LKTKLNAFTLLEMIFAIVVISVLASFAIPKFFNTTSDAKVSTLQRDITTVITSVQSYYLINMKIDKFSDAVNLNSKNWEIRDKTIIYKENEKNCVKLEITSNNLKDKIVLSVDSSVGNVCKKLSDNGIISVEYNLN
jgi:general secretion pathway protein G